MGQRELVSYEVTVRRKDGLRPASMCRRLHVDSAVKGSEQPDVLHSSRSGRGLKRKLGDDHDCEQERLLSLSLDKLRRVQQQAEPSLHRSVLLSNTLRSMQAPCGPRCRDDRPPPPSTTAADLHFGAFEIVNSTSYLTDLQPDDVFEDIDTSMCDAADLGALLLGGPRGGGAEDELLRGFFDLNDLDHIMEILVQA